MLQDLHRAQPSEIVQRMDDISVEAPPRPFRCSCSHKRRVAASRASPPLTPTQLCAVADAAELCRNTHPQSAWVASAEGAYMQLAHIISARNPQPARADCDAVGRTEVQACTAPAPGF